MTIETAKKCIDLIFNNIPNKTKNIQISLIGGEPLLEFKLIKEIFSYTIVTYGNENFFFFASTNGTVLTKEMKEWFSIRKEKFILGLSLDGPAKIHNFNRDNSFCKIDIDYFIKTWPNQAVKMTLSENSLVNLAKNIIFLHKKGFRYIEGVNLFEGEYNWNKKSVFEKLIKQLNLLVQYYEKNTEVIPNKMLNLKLERCELLKKSPVRMCEIGRNNIFFDYDGKQYPCNFCTPMTMDSNELEFLNSLDFNNNEIFEDTFCKNNCYIYPICRTCYGSNLKRTGNLSERDKSVCKIKKIITLFAADLQARRLVNNPEKYTDEEKYYLIKAIKKIRSLYISEFSDLF